MILIIILTITSLGINMFLITNPLSIGVAILCIALSVSLLFSYSISSWLAFLIFLIYVRGILVIFIYFVAVTPNQTINIIKILTILIITFSILFSLVIITNINPIYYNTYHIQTNIFYLIPNTPILIILATILLITIVIVVKLTINAKGPIRPFN